MVSSGWTWWNLRSLPALPLTFPEETFFFWSLVYFHFCFSTLSMNNRLTWHALGFFPNQPVINQAKYLVIMCKRKFANYPAPKFPFSRWPQCLHTLFIIIFNDIPVSNINSAVPKDWLVRVRRAGGWRANKIQFLCSARQDTASLVSNLFVAETIFLLCLSYFQMEQNFNII